MFNFMRKGGEKEQKKNTSNQKLKSCVLFPPKGLLHAIDKKSEINLNEIKTSYFYVLNFHNWIFIS